VLQTVLHESEFQASCGILGIKTHGALELALGGELPPLLQQSPAALGVRVCREGTIVRRHRSGRCCR
jgi:hypothetical protein